MTPTSETGADPRAAQAHHRSGFSLVELMVVVALIGLAATAVVLTLPDPSGRLDDEAARLRARLNLARDEAVLGGRPVALRLDADGYAFLRREDGQWRALDEAPLKPAEWSAHARPVLDGVNSRMIVFDPAGTAEPAHVRLMRNGRTVELTVDAAGEVTLDG